MTKKELPAYYPLTLELSQKLRGANLTAAEWRFWTYLTEIDPWGERYKDLSPLTIMTECKMSKPTYYRAKAKFQELEIFDFQEEKVSFRNLMGISSLRQSQEFNNSLKNDTASLKNDTASLKNDTTSLKNETEKSKMRLDSQKFNNESSEALPHKGSKVPQTLKTNTDFHKTNQTLSKQTEREQWEFFQKTLSGEELDSFMNFGVHTAKSFKESLTTTAIRLPEAWVKKNHQELYKQFLVALKEKYGTSDFQLILEGQCSENPPPVENQPIPSDIEYCSIANLKRVYGADWKNAATHFGIEIKE